MGVCKSSSFRDLFSAQISHSHCSILAASSFQRYTAELCLSHHQIPFQDVRHSACGGLRHESPSRRHSGSCRSRICGYVSCDHGCDRPKQYPLIGANGMDWMYSACSTTARRGALDWQGKFKDALKPVFNDLYDSVKNGTETKRSLECNSQKDYREKFESEMEEIRGLEIWRAGKAVRSLRPENN